MTEKSFSLSEFYHEIYVDERLDTVFNLISSAKGICSWFIGECEYTGKNNIKRGSSEPAQTGDYFFWKWKNKELEITGEVLESSAPGGFSFTFGKDFIVSIKLIEDGKRTLISLTQTYKTDAVHNDFAFINCCVCWVFFLTNLKSFAENNIDLRETHSTKETLVNY